MTQPATALSRCAQALPWIIAAALVLRLAGLGWDGFTGLHPDEGNLVRAAAALSWPDGLIPDFHAYNGLAVWMPRLLAWPVCGWEASAPCILWAARFISAVASGAAVLVAALWARDLAGPVAGALAAILLGGSAPLIQWAHFGTTESGLILVALILARLATAALDGRIGVQRTAILSGLVLGLGLGLKTTSLVFAIIPLFALVLVRPPLLAAAREVGTGVAIALLLWLITTPAIVLDWTAWRETMQAEGGVVRGTIDVFWTWQFYDRQPALFELRQLWGGMEGAGLLLAAIGFVHVFCTPPLFRRMAPTILFVLIYCAVIVTWHALFFRYLAPVLPFLMVFAALGAAWIWQRIRSETARVLLIVAVAVVIGNGLNQSAGYLAPDPRLTAAVDLAARALPGDVILLEPREVPFATPADTTRAELPLEWPLDTASLSRDLSQGRFLVVLSRRNWSVLPRLPDRFPGACTLYAGLASGRLGYRVVARHVRWTPLGHLAYPGAPMEETRVVFDAPEVLILERVEALSAEELALRLAEPVAPEDCAPETLFDRWRAPA